MNCGSKFVKILLFFFNFIFVICGLALIGLGAVTMTIYKNSVPLLGPSFSNAPVAIIIAGVVIFVVSFLGCCGAIQENKVLLIIFGVCLVVLLVAQVALCIVLYVYKNNVDSIVVGTMSDAVTKYKTSNDTAVHYLVDVTQQKFKCCGVNGTVDWGNNIPRSCCDNSTATCTAAKAYRDKCSVAISSKIASQIVVLALVALLVCLIEIVGMVLAFFLSRAVAEEYERV